MGTQQVVGSHALSADGGIEKQSVHSNRRQPWNMNQAAGKCPLIGPSGSGDGKVNAIDQPMRIPQHSQQDALSPLGVHYPKGCIRSPRFIPIESESGPNAYDSLPKGWEFCAVS